MINKITKTVIGLIITLIIFMIVLSIKAIILMLCMNCVILSLSLEFPLLTFIQSYVIIIAFKISKIAFENNKEEELSEITKKGIEKIWQ